MRIHQCKDNGTECTGGGTKNMLTPRKNKLLDCTILYPTKTLQFFRHSLWKVNLQIIKQQIQQFYPRNSTASFNIWHFSTSKNRTNRSPGSFCHGAASFLRSCWSLRLCRLPFCQTQAPCLRCFINRGVVGAPLIEMWVVFAFDGWRCGPWSTCKQHVHNMLHLYTVYYLYFVNYVWV